MLIVSGFKTLFTGLWQHEFWSSAMDGWICDLFQDNCEDRW